MPGKIETEMARRLLQTALVSAGLLTSLPLAAQDAMRRCIPNVGFALMIATGLHSIATGNLLPADVPVVCVDIQQAMVTKLADRGSFQTVGLVTDVCSQPGLPVMAGDRRRCLTGTSGLTKTKESADRRVVLFWKIKPYQEDNLVEWPDISGSKCWSQTTRAFSTLTDSGRTLYLAGFRQFPSRRMNPFGSKLLRPEFS